MVALRRGWRTLLPVALCLLLAGCGAAGSASSGGASGKLQVVAAENFWGSIAAQLGGDKVKVTSIITNPATDPHDYEPTAADARTLAGARLAIVNGIGYDAWAQKLLAANPVSGREVLNVGDLVGIEAGGNPHRWYSPPNVRQVIDAITQAYARLEPKQAAYFEAQRRSFEMRGLARYKGLIASIRQRYAGVPVGASESIFAPLAQSLGLRLLTPSGFLDAISEGTDPTARDKTTVDDQIAGRQIKVWVYNSQNTTPDVKRLNEQAQARGIPIATVTETLTPATASFQAWQVRQLQAIAAALAKATGR
ncbi:MAG TPA: zinc ABC transporter substrate-binding protein [Thermoleophilaceae bacterium]|jgi:zinc/manganese transport system substrate-binding protein